MTDEGLTELEVCVDDLVKEAVAKGYTVGPFNEGSGAEPCGCPIQALTWLGKRARTVLFEIDGCDFGDGFDGTPMTPETAESTYGRALYAMGLRFRERYVGSL